MNKPLPVRMVLHYLNFPLSERTQHRLFDDPLRRTLGLPPLVGEMVEEGALANRQGTLDALRGLASEFGTLKKKGRGAALQVLRDLHQRAQLHLDGFGLDRWTGRLEARWSTADSSFEQMLYGNLALALMDTRVLRCEECKRFFDDKSRRTLLYCSARCRNRTAVRQYRVRHPERYREYQRRLMKGRYGRVQKTGTERPATSHAMTKGSPRRTTT